MSSSRIGYSPRLGGMLRQCSEPGCITLTLGGRCIDHEMVVLRELPRGVPHPLPVPLSMSNAWPSASDPRVIRA